MSKYLTEIREVQATWVRSTLSAPQVFRIPERTPKLILRPCMFRSVWPPRVATTCGFLPGGVAPVSKSLQLCQPFALSLPPRMLARRSARGFHLDPRVTRLVDDFTSSRPDYWTDFLSGSAGTLRVFCLAAGPSGCCMLASAILFFRGGTFFTDQPSVPSS